MLISLWIYGYSLGIGSARELARRCQWDPAFQWLTGCDEVNYHTLSSFRVEQREELDDLFTQVLGLMSAEGLITLEQVVQDGTKIKAQASSTSFQGEARMQEHLERARQRVREMGEPDQEAGASRVEQARWRAGRERQERLERGLEELQKRAASKPGEPTLRVSVTDPDARKMKQPDGGFAPSYNVQICADAAQSVIVDVQVTQAGNDSAQLLPGLERIEARMGRKPLQMMADGDYTNRRSIEAMAEVGVDYLGSLRPSSEQRDMTGTGRLTTEVFLYDAQQDHYVCPQGMLLRYRGVKKKPSGVFRRSQAAAADCQSCPLKPQCCPGKPEAWPRAAARRGECSAQRLSPEDGHARSTTAVSGTRPGHRVLSRLDQEQAGPTAVSPARPDQSSNRSALGLPDLQPPAVDTAE